MYGYERTEPFIAHSDAFVWFESFNREIQQ